MCRCVGQGGVSINLYGPEGQTCGGQSGWGTYNVDCFDTNNNANVGTCSGHGGVDGLTLYGPRGGYCGGIQSWGTYQ